MTSDPQSVAQDARPGRDRLVVGLLVGAAIGLLVGSLAIDGEGDGGDRPVAEPPSLETTLQRIVTDPEDFLGEPAVVGSQVREIISPRAITVGQPGFVGPDMLVVTDKPLAAPTGRASTRPLLEGDAVTVSGEVRRFDVSELERDVGAELGREFDSFVGDDLNEREGDPVLRADSVVVNSRTTVVADGATPEKVVEQPGRFYGKVATVTGEVTRVLDSGALIVDGQLVALTADFAQRRPRPGQRVRMVGPVRPFDPDQLREGGAGPPDDDLLGIANRPAIVAQSLEIEPAPQ